MHRGCTFLFENEAKQSSQDLGKDSAAWKINIPEGLEEAASLWGSGFITAQVKKKKSEYLIRILIKIPWGAGKDLETRKDPNKEETSESRKCSKETETTIAW